MSTMSKSKLYEAVVADVEKCIPKGTIKPEVKSELMAVIDRYLKPRSASSGKPPKLDKEGNIVEAWCKFHQRYYTIDKMVMSGGKSKGYCKAGIATWNRLQKQGKDLKAKALGLLLAGDTKKGAELNTEGEKLIEKSKDYASYDADQDWANFKGK